MRRSAFAAAVAAVLSVAVPSRASLTPSEAEQVRRGVQTASDLPRVRALIARPDLSSDEAAAAIGAGLTTTPVDAAHVTFFHDMVFGDASAASRPVLAVATVRGALARADAVISQHGLDLERSPASLAELTRIYAWVEQVASASGASDLPESTRAQCAHAVADHLAHNGAVLPPSVPLPGTQVPRVRAQIAIALLDLMPDAPTRRIDAADALSLEGARRALLVERGVLGLDEGREARMATVRALYDRLPALRDGIEAIVVGGDPATFSARGGAVVTTPEDLGLKAGSLLLWGNYGPAPGDAWTAAVARSLATVAVSRAATKSDALRAQIERDGGVSAVAAMTAMLVLDGPRAVDVAARRLIEGAKESTACLADAIGALALFATPPASPAAGSTITVGPPGASAAPATPAKTAPPETQLTHVIIGATGAATTFRLDGHAWSFDRETNGAVSGLRRDGLPVTRARLASRP
jgi:hypothetical protein